jgi:hypothetical protein
VRELALVYGCEAECRHEGRQVVHRHLMWYRKKWLFARLRGVGFLKERKGAVEERKQLKTRPTEESTSKQKLHVSFARVSVTVPASSPVYSSSSWPPRSLGSGFGAREEASMETAPSPPSVAVPNEPNEPSSSSASAASAAVRGRLPRRRATHRTLLHTQKKQYETPSSLGLRHVKVIRGV